MISANLPPNFCQKQKLGVLAKLLTVKYRPQPQQIAWRLISLLEIVRLI